MVADAACMVQCSFCINCSCAVRIIDANRVSFAFQRIAVSLIFLQLENDRMDTRWLQDFVTLAELQNFTKAAEIRNVSQAAFSRRMQALEQWMGAKLIDRSSYPTRLTPAGEHFRLVASALLTQIADVRADIAEAPSRNHVRMASTYALASTWLPQWWLERSEPGSFTCSLDVGNVHDT